MAGVGWYEMLSRSSDSAEQNLVLFEKTCQPQLLAKVEELNIKGMFLF